MGSKKIGRVLLGTLAARVGSVGERNTLETLERRGVGNFIEHIVASPRRKENRSDKAAITAKQKLTGRNEMLQ